MLQKFKEWYRCEHSPKVPWALNELSDIKIINIEFKDNKVIEVHLRNSPDPQYDHIIPTWTSSERNDRLTKDGYKWISDYDDADGQLSDPRTGFWVK
jgi:hypothetical protein